MRDASPVDSKTVRSLIQAITQALPDRNRDPIQVIELALAATPAPAQEQMAPIVRRLVALSPRCWGIHRRKGWWRLLFHFLSGPEVLECYLSQFPPNLTDSQRHQLERELKRRFNLPQSVAQAQLLRFGLRQAQPRRRSHFCSCGGWLERP